MKKASLIFAAIAGSVIGIMGIVANVHAVNPFPTGVGGTGTSITPASGTIPIGNGSGSYTPAFLTPGTNIQITNGSGTVTIAVTGTATGTVYLLQSGHGISLSPSSITSSGTIAVNTSTVIADVVASGQFLPSSTVYVASVNGQSGAVTIGIPATTTINAAQATVFRLIGDGTTVTSTVNGATTTFSVLPNVFYPYGSNPANYLTGNQTITIVAAGDATGTASGATLITHTITVTGLQGKALPALATGTLKYTGGAWTFDGNTYLTSGLNVTTTAPLGGGGALTSAGLTLTCATCLTANQTITLTGAVTGSGATSIATTYTTSTLYSLFSGAAPITFNTSTGAIGWTNSLGYITAVTVNGQSGTSFNIVAGQGVTSTVSGATTTLTLNLGPGCSGGNFVQTISPTGTISCATPPAAATYTVAAGTGISTSIATSSSNTTTTVTLNINNGSVQNCGAGQWVNQLSGTGVITCGISINTVAGVSTSTISFIAAGGTSISTTTNSVTFTSVSTSTANTWTALQSYAQGITVNGTTTLASTTNALLVTNASGTIAGFAGSNCSAGQAPTGHSATGTVQNCTTYLQSNQSVTLTISGDATGTASGATAINDSITVQGLLGKSLPSLATGTLEYTGGAWTLASIPPTYTFAAGTGLSVSQATSTSNTTTTYTNTGVTSFNTATGTVTYGVTCSSGCTIASTTTSAAITVTASGGSNNATGTIDATAVFNATNTLISTQPLWVPSNFATNGCAGSSTATTLQGCIAALAASQVGVASGTSIGIASFVPAANWTAPMNLNINGFPVQIFCTAGTVLQYGGVQANASSGAIVFNFGNPGGHDALAEFPGCNVWGHSSKIIASNTNTATTTGVYFGGTNGAVGINFMGNLNGFGINFVMGQNAYLDAFTGTSSGGNGGVITGTGNVINGSSTIASVSNAGSIPLGSYVSGTGIPNSLEVIGISGTSITLSGTANATGTGATLTYNFGSLGQYDLASNSGERPVVSGSFTDPGNSSATNAIYITGGGVADWYCSLISLDDAQIHAGYSNGLIGCDKVHLEDSDFKDYGAYIPIWLDSSQATFADFGQISVANDPSAASTTFGFQTIIKHGVNLKVDGLFIQNYNGATVVNAVDHSLNNGSESEQICDVQTTNGSGLTNIVAGGGGNTYNQARGLGCSMDVANSYTITMYPNGSNTNNIDSGNSTVGTFDHTGNWTLGIAGTSGSLSVQGNITATGTITSSGNAYVGGALNVTSTASFQATTTFYGNVSSTCASGLWYGTSTAVMTCLGIGSNLSIAGGNLTATGGSGSGIASTSAYSSGYIPVVSSTGALANSSLYENVANGYIGLGTSTPTEILHIWKAAGNFTTIRYDSGATQGYFYSYSGDNSVNIGSNNAAQINFKVGNATVGYFSTSNQLVLQEPSGSKTIEELISPAASPQESTVTLMRISTSTATTTEFTDITDENYNATDTTSLDGGIDHTVSINISKQGNGQFRPFFVRFWNQDAGTISATGYVGLSVWPSTNSASTTPTSSYVGINIQSSTLPSNNLDVSSTADVRTSLSIGTTTQNGTLNVVGTATISATTTLSGIAANSPLTTNASSNVIATPNNPVPFYTYGVQFNQTTAAPGASSTVSLWGPFYWGAEAQCSTMTYDIGTGGGAGSFLDMGIYDINGNLVANTGAQTGNTTGVKNYAFTQGRKIIYPGDYFVGLGVTTTSIRMQAWASNYGWMQGGAGSAVANASGTAPNTTTFPASSTINTTVLPSFSCSY